MAKHVIQYNIFSGSPLNLASARVQIFLSDGGSPASLYSDYAGLSSLGSHEFAVPTGSFRVYANAGRYDIRAYDESGSFEMWYRDVEIGLAYDNSSYLVTDFGALADDSTDDSAAFIACQAAAVAAGVKHVIVPYGLYVINSTVDILGGVTWDFRGGRIRTTDDTTIIFEADGVDDWAFIGNIELKGTLVTSGSSAETGLRVLGSLRFKVENITARLFKGKGFDIDNDGESHTAERGQKGQWSNCAAYESTMGWDFNDGQSAEYQVLSTCSAAGCVTGVRVQGGNINWTGGNITDNGTGVVLVAGANEAHGMFNGVNINHNDIALDANGITLGHQFNNCNWYGDSASLGKIYIENSKGIHINGGDLDCRVEVQDGSATTNGLNILRNMNMVGANFNFAGDDLINLRSYGHYDFSGQSQGAYLGSQSTLVDGGVGFTNSWVDYGAGRNKAGFRLSESGDVLLQGIIKTGTIGTAAFTLPLGYRPENAVELAVDSNGAFGTVYIDTAGVVTPTVGNNAKVSLDGLRFRAKT